MGCERDVTFDYVLSVPSIAFVAEIEQRPPRRVRQTGWANRVFRGDLASKKRSGRQPTFALKFGQATLSVLAGADAGYDGRPDLLFDLLFDGVRNISD